MKWGAEIAARVDSRAVNGLVRADLRLEAGLGRVEATGPQPPNFFGTYNMAPPRSAALNLLPEQIELGPAKTVELGGAGKPSPTGDAGYAVQPPYAPLLLSPRGIEISITEKR